VLKASRSGYVSNYREPVRVQSSAMLERTITLTKQQGPAIVPADDGHAHTDLAWQLRHLTRSVLRDGADPGQAWPAPGASGPQNMTGGPRDVMSPFAAALADTDFRGQVDFVTTTTARSVSEWSQDPWPRGVAQLALGAPIAGVGAWQVRAALASGQGTSWNVLGEYESVPKDDHAWKLRLSYSAQAFTAPTELLSLAVAEDRTVVGAAAQDRWRVNPKIEVEYGVRSDRFDYLVNPYLFSAHGGFTAHVAPRTFVQAHAARTMIAPGVDEFLPPADDAPWLPAEQLFFPLTSRGALRAEELRRADVAVAYQLRAPGGDLDAPAIHLRRFWEQSTDQMATLFHGGGGSSRGQYAVAPVGSVDLAGWGIGVSGQIAPHVRGQVEYARVTAGWQTASRVHALRAMAPSALRDEIERAQDVTATVDVVVPRTSTRVSFVYRASNAFSTGNSAGIPLPGSRFDLRVHQELPYRPLRSSHLELIFAVRNLFHDGRADASWYDELLTVGPPVRLMGGIQLRF